MNKEPLIHYIKDKDSLIKAYYLALIPLFCFGFYKNGILLYQNELISFKDIFLPLYYPLISIIIAIMIAYIKKSSYKESILVSLIISFSISINTNMLIYPLVLFAALFITSTIKTKVPFNYLSLTRLMLILSLLVNSYSYLNVAEKIDAFDYNFLDVFFGHAIGGIFTSSLFFLLISFLILSFNKFYKKIIPILASGSYLVVMLGLFLVTKDIVYIEYLLNSTVYFAFIFIATDIYTPATFKGMLIYGLLIGVLTSLGVLIIPVYEVAFISIFVSSFLIPLINKTMLKKSLQ